MQNSLSSKQHTKPEVQPQPKRKLESSESPSDLGEL